MNLQGKIAIAGKTDTGLVRTHNEDAIGHDDGIGLAVIADGMGGHNAGEIASAIAITTIMEHLKKQVPSIKPVGRVDEESGYTYESIALREAIVAANLAIYEAAQKNPQYQGMGTTVVAALFYDDRASIAHVGDSRLYRMRDEHLEQITSDHTLLRELVDRGFYTEEEALKQVNRNVVTRALGIEPNVVVDVQEEPIKTNDILILCSDGLNDMAPDPEIHSTLVQFSANLEVSANKLIELAKNHGGKDNISVMLCEAMKPFSASRGWFSKFIDWLT
jgi:protein phosphatase